MTGCRSPQAVLGALGRQDYSLGDGAAWRRLRMRVVICFVRDAVRGRSQPYTGYRTTAPGVVGRSAITTRAV